MLQQYAAKIMFLEKETKDFGVLFSGRLDEVLLELFSQKHQEIDWNIQNPSSILKFPFLI